MEKSWNYTSHKNTIHPPPGQTIYLFLCRKDHVNKITQKERVVHLLLKSISLIFSLSSSIKEQTGRSNINKLCFSFSRENKRADLALISVGEEAIPNSQHCYQEEVQIEQVRFAVIARNTFQEISKRIKLFKEMRRSKLQSQ